MPELLLEFLSEEIPARMQARAASDLSRLVNDRLLAAGFMPEGVKAFAGPRRLALVAAGLPARQPDRREEKKGPRVGAPDKAVEGFLKSAGLSSLDQCEIREDKKGAYYVAMIDEKGRDTAAVIADFMPEIAKSFPWPKSMRWGHGDLRWVRPLHSVLCCFNHEIVDFEIDGVRTSDKTQGHRFLAPKEIRARDFDKYSSALRRAKVILDADERKSLIAGEAKTLCEAQGLELVEDPALLDEVAGLAEWPVPMIGSFDEKFLALPDEVLTASMRGHQKYFSVKDPRTGRLANKFVFVANIETRDAGAAMRKGYERVLTARLSDAWYLYHQDLKTPLKDRVKDLDRVVFFEGLGTMGDKARRTAALAKEIAPAVGADPGAAEEAALLAKADLVTQMVYEFPELQGVMGRYYALEQGPPALHEGALDSAPPFNGVMGIAKGVDPKSARSDPRKIQALHAIADAIRDHYKPAGQDDDVPTAPVSVAVALADKIDTLSAFYVIDKKPTGAGDPFALRRAALGVTALILKNGKRMRLEPIFNRQIEKLGQALPHGRSKSIAVFEVVTFVVDRLKVFLKENGHRYDYIDANTPVQKLNDIDDFVLIVRKLEALEAFLKTDDGANLVVAYKRAANILKAEEKKEEVGRASARHANMPHAPAWRAEARPTVEEHLFRQAEENVLYAALTAAEEKAKKAVAAEKFEDAMAALASLRAPIDAFFDKVTVNADDKALRANRLALLARFRAATAEVADLSKLEG